MEHNGISKLDVKRRNRVQILKYIRYSGPQSRIDISDKLKLTRAAVTIITTDMINQGIIYETGEDTNPNKKSTRGRRKISLDICRNYKLVFGVSIESERLIIGLTNLFGETLDKLTMPLGEVTYIQLLEIITNKIESLVKTNYLSDSKILGIGVCVSEGGCKHIEEKNNVSKIIKIRKDLSHAFSVPVVSGRTIDGAALAQFTFDNDISDTEKYSITIRYGSEIDSTVSIGNVLFAGATGNSCGMKRLQNASQSNSSFNLAKLEVMKAYSQENTPYLYESTGGDITQLDSVMPDYDMYKKDFIIKNILDSLNAKLAGDFHMIETIMDCEEMYVFGNYLDCQSNIEQINENIGTMYGSKFRIKHSLVTSETLFLCGCAFAVQEFFVNKGGAD